MAYHTFGPGLAIDHTTMRGVPAMAAYLEDADTGDPVQAFTMDEEPFETTVRTNRFGYFPQFQVDETVRRLRIRIGEVELIHGAWELIYKAESSAAGTLTAAQAAQAAAERAAALVDAPADIVVAELIENRGTATQRVLHGLYGARGNTFVQPTEPPAGTTYEWAGARNNSESIKKIDGVEVTRNLATTTRPNSRGNATITRDVEFQGELWDSLHVTTNAHGTRLSLGSGASVVQAIPDGHPATASYDFANPSDQPVTVDIDWADFQGPREIILPGEVRRLTHTTSREVYGNFRFSDIGLTSPIPGTILFRNVSIEPGETSGVYFDGDTPDDHANDVWFNTTDNRQYTWDSETKTWTQVPAGLNDTGIAALVEDTSSDTRTALNETFGPGIQAANTAAALQAPGPVRDAFNEALKHYGVPRAEGSPGARLVFGALRNYGSSGGYWQPIDDSGHDPVGIESVDTASDRITITTTPVDGATVVGGTLIAVVDETLARLGYFVGGSGGGRTTNLMIGRNYSVSDRIWWGGASTGFEAQDGTHYTMEWSSPSLRLYPTERMFGRNAASIDWQGTASAGQFVHPVIVAQTEVEIAIQFFDASGARLSTPHTGCRFYIHSNDSMNAGQIDPRDMDHPNGNIWFMLVQTYR